MVSKINQSDRARLAWSVLTTIAKKNKTCTYGELGSAIGVHHRALRYALSPIQDYCLEEHLPPLTILVLNTSGRPGTGFIAHDTNDLDSGFEAVWSYNWDIKNNPFDFSAQGLSFDDLLNNLIKTPENAQTVYSQVRNRGILQLLFRAAVLQAYSNKCAFTGISIPEAMEACHIVPWSIGTPQQRMDVRNGILLNPLHHKLFDIGLITITTEYKIDYKIDNSDNRHCSVIEKNLTADLSGSFMKTPRLVAHQPLIENIIQHNNLFFTIEESLNNSVSDHQKNNAIL